MRKVLSSGDRTVPIDHGRSASGPADGAAESPVESPAGGLILPKRLILFDLDGVVYRGDTPTPHAAEVIAALQSAGYQVQFLTNNSSRTRESYCARLAAMGVEAGPSQIMTSGFATALYLQQEGFAGRTALAVSEEGLWHELEQAGIVVKRAGEDFTGGPVDVVVVGIDRSFTYSRLTQAQQALLAGARFIATNADPTFPTEQGDLPGGGSIVAAIATASGQTPFVVGKPNTFSLELILQSCHTPREQAVLIGDRLDTDIAVGRSAGMDTILTLTGVTSRDQAAQAPPSMRPNAIIQDLGDLEAVLRP
ncbi:MAG: HAD-IIA family hydrolase [Chloroflexi bacterium]|nr:HAD-IIA family hydrolase [Chloroflexota bacterium]